MSDDSSSVGSIAWTDLTVNDAQGVCDFYSKVVGWKPQPVDMGDYADFNMTAPGSGEAIAGICHARGTNAGLPAQWMVYLVVANVEEAAACCTREGGRVLVAPKKMGEHGAYCVIQDPAGAVAALFQPAG